MRRRLSTGFFSRLTRHGRDGAEFVVLTSSPRPLPTTNPYVVMLNQAIDALPGVRLEHFSWRTAVIGRYDVFHVHWPETLVVGGSRLKRSARQLLLPLVLVRMWVLGIPLVRTVHNLELPRGLSPVERILIRLMDRRTALRIRVNASTEIASAGPTATVIHGHYRDWFAPYPIPRSVPGRMTFFGAVRRYKGAQALVEAFRSVPRADLTLRVAGRPSTAELESGLRTAAAGDERISLALDFLSDAELVAEVGAAELVVLPYPEMHNSGGVLAALSLGRPVLVPDNGVNRELAAEVGPGWVLTYPHPLRPEHLSSAIDEVRAQSQRPEPDLSAREWSDAGRLHVEAFRRARRSG